MGKNILFYQMKLVRMKLPYSIQKLIISILRPMNLKMILIVILKSFLGLIFITLVCFDHLVSFKLHYYFRIILSIILSFEAVMLEVKTKNGNGVAIVQKVYLFTLF